MLLHLRNSTHILLAIFSQQYHVYIRSIVNVQSTYIGGSTTMLIEDINRDIWDADCEFLTDEMDPDPHQSSNETSSSSNIGNYVCTVFAEVHSDPVVYQASSDGNNQQLASSVRRTNTANILATDTDDEDVSTQMLDISRSNATSLSYNYSVHSTTAPSHISQDTPNSTSSGSHDSAQEIVDVVQSKGFVTDTAVLRSGSSQLSLFTDHQDRGCHTDPELSSYTPLIDGSAPAGANGRAEQREMIIPLNELDNRFGVAIMWEDWEQEIQTVL